jgi:hypothetical protein
MEGNVPQPVLFVHGLLILKNDQQQTKSKTNLKKSQDMNRSDTLIRQLCPRAIHRV